MEALMTTITKEQVAHIAHLSRLEIQENEVDGYIEKLEKVVELFDTINNAPTENVKPTYHVLDLVNVFREDVAKPGMDREEVLKNAHETEAGQFKVPTIIE
jgi:aspartyl/glutamyl-tRNA(asn/gln) amidotransferase, C subunit